MKNNIKAILYSSQAPSPAQEEKFRAFVSAKYGEDAEFSFVKDETIKKGFRLTAGSETYDWTDEGRLNQLKKEVLSLYSKDNVIPLIRETVKNWTPKALAEETGTVISVGDGIAKVTGLTKATYGEILIFESGVRGMVLNLKENELGCILFDDDNFVTEGSVVKRTERVAGIPVGDNFLGRIVNSLGSPIDGEGEIISSSYRPVESAAPSIVERQQVRVPMETGILAIDSMFPIGRGQRELIIGDRQTGKTAIALDTIINQKGKNCICIYVAIGAKASSVSSVVNMLKKHGAMDYTCVLAATASDPAPLLYIAPYAGCALAEYFMYQGKDVLIVYDDLSKHAVAYRSLSLLLGRSPGREAYPGDVFYLHSRLLERSARLSDELGGGSITALPVVETQSGDVAAYIPTNIISITDGQIFLESDLFYSGQRPAVNIGLSVSRVGGDAQLKAMKKSVKGLRLDLAQYREMKVFTQFASDLDEATRRQLAYGKGLMRLLCQKQASPYSLSEQIVIITMAQAHVLDGIRYEDIERFIKELLSRFHKNNESLLRRILSTGLLSDADKQLIIDESRKAASDFK
ncbi:MAG: F0F1 ATP synthase subunit alpha [Clostridia bacterium]|nr:F0F1 ATP synthase subunit alpha [Clostridia bacterium]